jgi:hypothetical protein
MPANGRWDLIWRLKVKERRRDRSLFSYIFDILIIYT